MKYIMVTDFDKHWDRIEKNYTSYTPKMIKHRDKRGEYVNGTDTLFIKRNKHDFEIENAWLGKVWDIQQLPGMVLFRVEIIEIVPCPGEYLTYKNGWYSEE